MNPEKFNASDAHDLTTYVRDYGHWISAVMQSIQLDAKHNSGRNTEALAGVGRFVVDDLRNFMDCEAERIRQALE